MRRVRSSSIGHTEANLFESNATEFTDGKHKEIRVYLLPLFIYAALAVFFFLPPVCFFLSFWFCARRTPPPGIRSYTKLPPKLFSFPAYFKFLIYQI